MFGVGTFSVVLSICCQRDNIALAQGRGNGPQDICRPIYCLHSDYCSVNRSLLLFRHPLLCIDTQPHVLERKGRNRGDDLVLVCFSFGGRGVVWLAERQINIIFDIFLRCATVEKLHWFVLLLPLFHLKSGFVTNKYFQVKFKWLTSCVYIVVWQ